MSSQPNAAEPDAVHGAVRWDPLLSMWNGGMVLAATAFGPATFSLSGFATLVGLALLATIGVSVGHHRLLAHHAFETGPTTRRVLAWLGVIAGIGGPLGSVRAHHLSDWAERQPAAHPFFTHRGSLIFAVASRMTCRIELVNPPRFDLSQIETDPVLQWLEQTWMLHHALLAGALFLVGGWPLVIWGVCVRLSVSTVGYWLIAHLAHRPAAQGQSNAATGRSIPWAAHLTLGEAWHDNHHAYPASAKIGIHPGQSDWGWRVIQMLERAGLVWDVRTPETLGPRPLVGAE